MSIFSKRAAADDLATPQDQAEEKKKIKAAKGLLSTFLGVDPNEVVALVQALLAEMKAAREDLAQVKAFVIAQEHGERFAALDFRMSMTESILENVLPEYAVQMQEMRNVPNTTNGSGADDHQ